MKNAFLTYTAVTDMPTESQSIDSTPIVEGGYGVVEYRSRWAKAVDNKMVLYREIADGMKRFGQFIVWTTEANGKVTKSFHEAAFGLGYGEGI